MKLFITFLGLLIVCLSLLCFSSDIDRYAKLQMHMKALAEDCAAGSMLFTNAEEYAAGRIVINEDDAARYVDFLLSRASGSYELLREGRLEAEIRLFDERKGYEGSDVFGIEKECPSCVITINWEGPDIFRLPFFELRTASRTAVYEWAD
ncbi:MAG: hypothetical protein GX975_04715 [Clostridiales bacterium]|nr:hypothetical protein [Clostridiales bacterium]